MLLIIIYVLCTLPALPILYYTFKGAGQYNNGMYFMVRVPASEKDNLDIQKIIQSFNHRLKQVTWLNLFLFLVGIGIMAFTNVTDFIILFTLIILSPIFLPIFLSNHAIYLHRKLLLAYKQKMNWPSNHPNIVYADLATSRAKNLYTPKSYLFLIPMVISTAIYFIYRDGNSKGMLILFATILFLHSMFWFFHHYISHGPAKIYSDNSQINISLNQNYRRNWSMAYLLLSFSQNLWIYALAAFHVRFVKEPNEVLSYFFITLLILMSILPVFIILLVYQKQKKLENSLLTNNENYILDEDIYYEYHGCFWGFQYNNPNNSATMINKPFGIGQALNLGTKKGQIFMVTSKIIFYVTMIGTIGIVGFEDFVSPEMQVTASQITIYQTLYPVTIDKNDIESIQLSYDNINDIHFYKNIGSATNQYLRGAFASKGNPNNQLYLYRKVRPYLHIKLKDHSKYNHLYFNYKNPENTEKLYQKVKEKMEDKIISRQTKMNPDINNSLSSELYDFNNLTDKQLSQLREKTTNAEIDYSIAAGNGTLHAVLNMPNPPVEKPAVVLIIGGSGPSTKEGLANLYLDLALQLNHQGIATLRFDKRGIARSGSVVDAKNEEDKMIIEDFVGDVIALLQKAKADSRFSGIYIAGHSEGSLIGILAAEKKSINGFISLAGAGRNIGEITLEQIHANPNNPKQLLDTSDAIVAKLKKGETTEDIPQILQALFRPSVQAYLISWMKYEPMEELAKLKDLPTLIIQGENDSQVQVMDGEKLHQAHPASKLVIIPKMTHMLKDSDTPKAEAYTNNQSALAYAKVYQDDSLLINSQVIQEIAEFVIGTKEAK